MITLKDINYNWDYLQIFPDDIMVSKNNFTEDVYDNYNLLGVSVDDAGVITIMLENPSNDP